MEELTQSDWPEWTKDIDFHLWEPRISGNVLRYVRRDLQNGGYVMVGCYRSDVYYAIFKAVPDPAPRDKVSEAVQAWVPTIDGAFRVADLCANEFGGYKV